MKAAPLLLDQDNGAAEHLGVDGDQLDVDVGVDNSERSPPSRPAPSSPRLRESDDSYPRVIVYLSARHRIVNCIGDVQWIEQIRKGGCWRNRSFFRNRDVLIERTGATGAALVTLRMLPRMHP